MPLRKEPASQSQLFCRVTCESESAMLPGMCDLRVRVSYFEADLRVRVSYFEADLRVRVRGFEPTCESESEVLEDKKQPASQSQLFCRVTCESESAILQDNLHGQGFRLRSIQLKVECLAACGSEGMLLRKSSHVWQRSSPKECSSCPCESESDVFHHKLLRLPRPSP